MYISSEPNFLGNCSKVLVTSQKFAKCHSLHLKAIWIWDMGNFINVTWNAEEQKKIKFKMFNTSVRQKANEKMQSELSYFSFFVDFRSY